jgi:hypothetical protein
MHHTRDGRRVRSSNAYDIIRIQERRIKMSRDNDLFYKDEHYHGDNGFYEL